MTLDRLHAFRRMLSRRFIDTVDVVCVGTSSTFGTGASAVDAGIVSRLGQILRGRLGNGTAGVHYLPTHPDWTRSGSWAHVGRDFGQASTSLTAGGSLARTALCTGFRVWFKQGTSMAATFTVYVDGTPHTVAVQAGNMGAYDGVWTSPVLPRGQHTLLIAGPTTGSAEIGGVYAFDGDEQIGVRVWNAGTPAVISAVWVSGAAAAASHWRRAGSLDPALMVMIVGSNDHATQIDPATFKANIGSAIRYARLASRSPLPVLLVLPYLRPGLGLGTYSFASYGQRLAELAAELPDVDYLDVSPHWPVDEASDVDHLFNADGVHPSDAGHAWMAELIAGHLLGDPITAQASATPPPTSADPADLPGLVSAWRASDLAVGADGDPVASWAPYAGRETAALAQTNTARRPVLRMRQAGGQPAVEFRQPTAPYSTNGAYLSTPAWSIPAGAACTVVGVMRLDRNYGNAWSGVGSALSMLILGSSDMVMGMMSGASTNGSYVTTGAHRWAVYAAVYNGPDSRMWQTGCPVQQVTIGSHASAGLGGLTLAANASGGNTGNLDVAELFVYHRALTDTEAQGVLDVLARRYSIDRAGHSQG
jgi:lysophospholipase L1-like esterase